MLITEEVKKKWKAVIEEEDKSVAPLSREEVTILMMENQSKWNKSKLNESVVPDNTMGSGAIDTWSPVLIKMAKRISHANIGFDLMGVQPMKAPDGQIFAMRARYASQTGDEAFMSEANTAYSGDASGTHAGDSHGFPVVAGEVTTATTVGPGMSTADAEKLGSTTGNAWGKMAVSIEKSTVSAKTRALMASYSSEIREDMKAVHGEDVDKILTDILVTEIQAEQNREIIRLTNISAKFGGVGTTAIGIMDLALDTTGRWSAEKFRELLFVLELESNSIAKETRRGKGNKLITTSNVASALAMAGLIDHAVDYNKAMGISAQGVNDVNSAFVGTLPTGHMVYVDAFASVDYMSVLYKGANQLDAGLFYCPYIPLTMYRASGEDTLSDGKVGFKTRYGIVANPYNQKDAAGNAADSFTGYGPGTGYQTNAYGRKLLVKNLL